MINSGLPTSSFGCNCLNFGYSARICLVISDAFSANEVAMHSMICKGPYVSAIYSY